MTLALSVVLFVKYIFLDKSTTFAMSVPPTPSSSAPPIDSAPVSACPIKMSDGPSIAVRQRHTTNSGASSTTYSEECPHLTDQTSISSSTASNGVLPTLQYPLTLQNVSPGISSCGVNVPVSSERECLPALGAGPDGKQEIMFSSVAVQTVAEEGGVFVALRQDSLSGSDTSGVGASGDEVTTGEEEEEEDGGKRGEERPPRPVAECLSIFQSDVSPSSLLSVKLSPISRITAIVFGKFNSPAVCKILLHIGDSWNISVLNYTRVVVSVCIAGWPGVSVRRGDLTAGGGETHPSLQTGVCSRRP